MEGELGALCKLGVCELVSPDTGSNLVKCKWVFWVKYHLDGHIDRYRARLLAKGF